MPEPSPQSGQYRYLNRTAIAASNAAPEEILSQIIHEFSASPDRFHSAHLRRIAFSWAREWVNSVEGIEDFTRFKSEQLCRDFHSQYMRLRRRDRQQRARQNNYG